MENGCEVVTEDIGHKGHYEPQRTQRRGLRAHFVTFVT